MCHRVERSGLVLQRGLILFARNDQFQRGASIDAHQDHVASPRVRLGVLEATALDALT